MGFVFVRHAFISPQFRGSKSLGLDVKPRENDFLVKRISTTTAEEIVAAEQLSSSKKQLLDNLIIRVFVPVVQ